MATPSIENWHEVIPARAEVTIEGVDSFEDHLAIYERERGLEKICIRDGLGAFSHYIDFPEPVYTVARPATPNTRPILLRFNYTSLVTPTSVFDYNVRTRERELKKQYEVRGGYDASQYQSERIFAKAPDGVEVPISLVYRKGFERNGTQSAAALRLRRVRPQHRSAVFVRSAEPARSRASSSPSRISAAAPRWAKNGTITASCWRRRNTFTDFIACAEHLIAARYTSSDRLAIMGGSAGGLLMGAVLNMRPELFHAAIAKVPFVDTLNTMLDPTLPLTMAEYEEWGNPEDKEYYDYIRSYSPYDNVAPREYPTMLVTAGLNDPRVSYWEPAKWVAKLRALKKDSNVLLLKTDMGSGHFGPSGRYEGIKEMAFDYAFLLDSL